MLGGVVEHAGADAIFPAAAGQDVAVDAMGILRRAATLPIGVVVGQLGESHGHVAQCRVDAHHGRLTRQAEELGVRPAQARQREGHHLDARGQMVAAELLLDNQAGVGHIVFVAPRLDVAESGELLFRTGQSDDGLAFLHLRGQVFVSARSDAAAALLGRIGDGGENLVHIFLVGGVGHYHLDAVVVVKLQFIFHHCFFASVSLVSYLGYIHCLVFRLGTASFSTANTLSSSASRAITTSTVSSPATVPRMWRLRCSSMS